MADRKNIIPVASLVLAAVVCIVAISAPRLNREPESEIEKRVYARIVAECASELEPVYRDFGIKLPRSPGTIAELVRPLLSVTSPDDATSPSASQHAP